MLCFYLTLRFLFYEVSVIRFDLLKLLSFYFFSLPGDEDDEESEDWKCEKCECVGTLSPFERLQHTHLHEKESGITDRGL